MEKINTEGVDVLHIEKDDGVFLINEDSSITTISGELTMGNVKRLIGCDVVELCNTITGGTLIIDEEGKLHCNTPFCNNRATELYAYSRGNKGQFLDIIFGKAVYLPKEVAVEFFN